MNARSNPEPMDEYDEQIAQEQTEMEHDRQMFEYEFRRRMRAGEPTGDDLKYLDTLMGWNPTVTEQPKDYEPLPEEPF